MNPTYDLRWFELPGLSPAVRARHCEPPHHAPCNSCGRRSICVCEDGKHLTCYCHVCYLDLWGEPPTL